MRCRLEEDTRRYNILLALAKGFEKGDFSELFPFLRDDCRLVSMWVALPLEGYEAVTRYLTGKARTLEESKCFAKCSVVELSGRADPAGSTAAGTPDADTCSGRVSMLCEEWRYALRAEQTVSRRTVTVLLDLTLDEQGMVKQIDFCDPELFSYTSSADSFTVCARRHNQNNEDSTVRISEEYLSDLILFLQMAGIDLGRYTATLIPMEKWLVALACWKDFCEAESFDTALKKLAGVDYSTWHITRPDVLRSLVGSDSYAAENRLLHAGFQKALREWTDLYRNDHDAVFVMEV